MANILIAPSKYVQGPGELKKAGSYLKNLGQKAMVLISASGKKRFGAELKASLEGTGVEMIFENFNGECSKQEVDRILALTQENGCDVVAGVGGGKILDTAKAVAHYGKLPIAILPTIASTDAPCSALSVLYTEEGVFDQYLILPANPNLVLVDTDVIAKAPARLLVAGMGDALATMFEARATKRSNSGTIAGGNITLSAMALADLCYNTLMADGLKAKLAAEAGVCTKAVENVIEANTLLSGLGFESGGLAAAHAVHNGFTVLEECHHLYHGEKVAFGTLTQLVLENAPMEEIEEVVEFCIDVGLPVTLAQMGVKEVSPERMMACATAAAAPGETIHNMPFPVTPESVYAAIMGADAIGKAYVG